MSVILASFSLGLHAQAIPPSVGNRVLSATSDCNMVGDGNVDNAPLFSACILRAISASKPILFPIGRFRFASKPDNINGSVCIRGTLKIDSADPGTVLIADYSEPNSRTGFLSWTKGSPSSENIYGCAENIAIVKAAEKTGGTAIKLLSGLQRFRISNVQVKSDGRNGVWDFGLFADGFCCQVLEKVQDVFVHKLSVAIDAAREGGLLLTSVQNFYLVDLLTGNSNATVPSLTVSGGPNAMMRSSNVQIVDSQIFGSMIIQNASAVSIQGLITGSAYIGDGARNTSLSGQVGGQIVDLGTATLLAISGHSTTNPLTVSYLPSQKASRSAGGGCQNAKSASQNSRTKLSCDPTASSVAASNPGTDIALQNSKTLTREVVRAADQYPGVDASAKIAAAIADLPSGLGVVDARGFGNSTQKLAGTISVRDQQTIIFDPATKFVPSSTSATVLTLSRGARVLGPLHVDLSSMTATYTGSVVSLAAVDGTHNHPGAYLELLVDGADGATGSALSLTSNVPAAGIAFGNFTVTCIGLQNPVIVTTSAIGAWINSNFFHLNLTGPSTMPITGITLLNNGLEVRGNHFDGAIEGNGVSQSVGISAAGSGTQLIRRNTFDHMNIWDVTTNWRSSPNARENFVRGNLDGVSSDSGTLNSIVPNGKFTAANLTGTLVADHTDINSLTGFGMYAGQNLVNQPAYFTAEGGFVLLLNLPSHDANYASQFAYDLTSADANKHVYLRRKTSGKWGAWTEMPDAQNVATETVNVGKGKATITTAGKGTFSGGIDTESSGISNAGPINGATTLVASGQITSTLATGTPPFSVSSTTVNANLNADLWDGKHLRIYRAALAPAEVAARTCAAQTVTVTGITASAHVVNRDVKPTDQPGLILATVRATATNNVSLQFCNLTAFPITPTAETYTFYVVY